MAGYEWPQEFWESLISRRNSIVGGEKIRPVFDSTNNIICLKDSKLEIVDLINYLRPLEKGAKRASEINEETGRWVSVSPRILTEKEELINSSLLFYDLCDFFQRNFEGFTLETAEYYNNTTLFAAIIFEESKNDPFSFPGHMLNLEALEIFTQKSQGGLIFNCSENLKSGEAIRPLFNRNSPTGSINSYDIKSCNPACLLEGGNPEGHLIHYTKKDVEGELKRNLSGSYFFRDEFRTVSVLLYLLSSDSRYDIVTTYHNFCYNSQFFAGNYGFDLVVILKRKDNGSVSFKFYNSNNEYFHGFCDKYPNCPGNGGKLKRFVGGKSGTELARISVEKYVDAKRLLSLSLVDKEFTFERIYTCHFFTGLKDPSSGFTTDTMGAIRPDERNRTPFFTTITVLF